MKRTMLLMSLGATFMISCESRTYTDISAPPAANPTYEANVKPIIDAECANCHFEGGDEPPLTNYAQVKDAAENGKLLCEINAQCGVMPETGKMPQALVDVINLWAEQGYLEK